MSLSKLSQVANYLLGNFGSENYQSFDLTANMVSRNTTYREMEAAGLFSSEGNCTQYLIDVGILAQKKRCTRCASYMMIRPCPATKYREGSCWQCCNTFVGLRDGSILQNRKLSYRQFIDVLSEFSRDSTVNTAAVNTGVSEKCVQSLFNEIRELIAEDIKTYDKLGGPQTIVEIDEAKFGKRKFSRGRLVEGSWVIGVVQRNSNRCFLALFPQLMCAVKPPSCRSSNRTLLQGLWSSQTSGRRILILADTDTFTKTSIIPLTLLTHSLVRIPTASEEHGLM